MRLEPNLELFTKVFGATFSPASLVIQQQGYSIQTVIEALTKAATDCFGIELIEQPLSTVEWQEILAQPSLELA